MVVVVVVVVGMVCGGCAPFENWKSCCWCGGGGIHCVAKMSTVCCCGCWFVGVVFVEGERKFGGWGSEACFPRAAPFLQ